MKNNLYRAVALRLAIDFCYHTIFKRTLDSFEFSRLIADLLCEICWLKSTNIFLNVFIAVLDDWIW